MIRKGAIGYWGATGVASLECNVCRYIIKNLTGNNCSNITLGETYIDQFGFASWEYILLGDPTLQLKLKQVNWD